MSSLTRATFADTTAFGDVCQNVLGCGTVMDPACLSIFQALVGVQHLYQEPLDASSFVGKMQLRMKSDHRWRRVELDVFKKMTHNKTLQIHTGLRKMHPSIICRITR